MTENIYQSMNCKDILSPAFILSNTIDSYIRINEEIIKDKEEASMSIKISFAELGNIVI